MLAGCGLVKQWSERQEVSESIRRAQALLASGDYGGSAEAYQKVLRLARGRSPADVALFDLGLIYVDPKNSSRDDHKAMNSFREVLTVYPKSPLAGQARLWLAMLDEKARSAEEAAKSREAVEKSHQELEKFKQIVEQSKQEIERSRQEVEKSKQVLEKSKQVLEKSNQVDIEIEQKKRERGR